MTRRFAAATATFVAASAVVAAATAEGHAPTAAPRVKLHAIVKLQPGGGATLRQHGTFSGAPLGRGTVDVVTRLGSRNGTHVTFVLRAAHGTVSGAGDAKISFNGTIASYRGTAKFISGTGAYKGFRRNGLRFSGKGDLAGDTFEVNIAG